MEEHHDVSLPQHDDNRLRHTRTDRDPVQVVLSTSSMVSRLLLVTLNALLLISKYIQYEASVLLRSVI